MKSTLRKTTVALAACAAMFTLFSASANAADYTLGIWGDMPYAKAEDQPKIPALLDDMNASDIAFSIYDGDIKDGSSKCTDDVYDAAKTMFNALKKPTVYVPGDNEWTDCHRTNNGGYDNLERLSYIRKVMFETADSFGAEKMALEHQGKIGEKFVENTRFVKGPAMFVGLNVPGSNNNKVNSDEECTKKSARTLEQCAADNAEYVERDKANIEWLKASFAAAKTAGLKGVMLVVQGDVGFDIPETEDTDESRLPNKDGYAAFIDAVYNETLNFPGQVAFIHGDTHFLKMDKPLKDATHMLPNFTRVQTFGSPNVHWVKVTVDGNSRDVFTFSPMIVEANAKVGIAK